MLWVRLLAVGCLTAQLRGRSGHRTAPVRHCVLLTRVFSPRVPGAGPSLRRGATELDDRGRGVRAAEAGRRAGAELAAAVLRHHQEGEAPAPAGRAAGREALCSQPGLSGDAGF